MHAIRPDLFVDIPEEAVCTRCGGFKQVPDCDVPDCDDGTKDMPCPECD